MVLTYVLVPHLFPPRSHNLALIGSALRLEQVKLVFVEHRLVLLDLLEAFAIANPFLHPASPATQGGAHLREG